MKRRDLLRLGAMLTSASPFLPFRAHTGAVSQQASKPTASLRSFRINFGKERIEDLHRRLDRAILPEMAFETGWSAGTNDRVLRDLVRYWRHTYDWFAEQEMLNRLTHLRGPIQGEQMHVVVYRASRKTAGFPLLLVHGWPSTFLEFAKAAPLLAKGINDGPAFEVLVPSLPGFAFSEPPRAPGMHPGKVAERLHVLMRELGYERYGVAGYDWGSVISNDLALKFPEAVVGLHKTGAPWSPPPPRQTPTADEQAYFAHRDSFDREERAYGRIQGTKPQTLSYALQDSPLGLLAWILEKYWAWSDHGEDLWRTFERDHVLTTVMLYWLTGRVLSSARIYYERDHRPESESPRGSITTPTAFARFPKDPFVVQRPLIGEDPLYANVVRVNEMPRGGHYPAIEVPELWAGDVATFFSKL